MLIDKGLFSGKALFKVRKIQLTEDVEAYIRQISLADYTLITEKAEKDAKSNKTAGSFDLPVQMIIASLCDEFGNKLFAPEDEKRIMETLPMGIIIKISNEITAFNNLSGNATAAAGSEVKNSTDTPNGDSYSVFAAN
jgi:hypothetical protein